MRNLAEEVFKIWQENRMDFDSKLRRWLRLWERGTQKIIEANLTYRQWHSFRLYTAVANAEKGVFSLRFCGQEVGYIVIDRDGKKFLKLNDTHVKNNRKYFDRRLPGKGMYEWTGSSEAKEFISMFEKNYTMYKSRVRQKEHVIESMFIDEMFKRSPKFGKVRLDIHPVTIGSVDGEGGLPLQVPVPITASDGKPKAGKGNIDILSRRKGKDGKTRLCVWELKGPEAKYDRVASQAAIYALTFICILHHTDKEISNGWYKILGFKGKIPKKLEIEAVVAVDPKNKKNLEGEDGEKQKLKEVGSLELNGDIVKLYAAYYTEKSDSITFDDNPFPEE